MLSRAESRLRLAAGLDDVQSDDGGYGRRGEVELQDLGALGRSSMQRRPSMPELVSHAGEKGGAQRSSQLLAGCLRSTPRLLYAAQHA